MDEKKPIGVGSILGGFKIEKELGKGGMGTVYRAHELSLNRKVALKILPKRLSFDEEFVKRFKREAQVVAALNHPNIVNILSYGEEHGQQYFAMEYIKGKDLGQILEEKTVLPTQQALSVTAQVASALGEASVRGVIHRDLKPANIMIDEMDRVKVTDFGVAHFQYADSKLTRTGLFVGTPEYSSPEQATGRPLDVRSDIYSLGAMLFKMLSGEPPVKGESPLAVVAKIASEPVTPIEQINPSVPKPVCRLIKKMMAREPNDRFQFPKEIIVAIDECINELKLDAPLDKSTVVDASAMPRLSSKETSYGKKIGGIIGIALAVFFIVWILDSAIKTSKPPLPVPKPESVVTQLLAADQLLVKGRFVTGPHVDPPAELTGGVIRSNISDKTFLSSIGAFQFKNTKPLRSNEELLISAVFYAKDKRIFRAQGGTFQRRLEEVTELDCGEIPLEPYGVSIEDIPVKVTDWTGVPISGDRVRVKIGDKVAAWAGESFIGSWTFTKKDETVAIKAEYVMSDGRTALGQYNLSLNQFDILDQPQSVSPITVTLQKPSPPPLAKIPTVLIAVSGDETIRPFVHVNIETSLLGTGLKVTSASEIPVLYKKIQLGQTPITWYRLKQLVPKDRADILLLAEVQKTGSTTLEFYGLTEKLTIVSFSVRAVDMATGISAASPATGSVKFTSLNMEENFREALTPALLEMGQMIKRYWQDKIQAGKR